MTILMLIHCLIVFGTSMLFAFKLGYTRCRDCKAKIYKHTIHKCPVSGKRYKGM